MGGHFLHLSVEALEVPPYFEYVGDEGDVVECDDEHWTEARYLQTAAYQGQLAPA